MNIAFPALVVFLLLLPGILLRYGYRRGAFRKTPISLGSFRRSVAAGVVWALAFHTISLSLLHVLADWSPDVETILLITSKNADQLFSRGMAESLSLVEAAGAARTEVRALFVYLVASVAIAYAVGLFLHLLVRKLHLDLRYHFLQFENEWFYLFEGEQRVIAADARNRTLRNIRTYLAEYPTAWLSASVVIEQGGKSFLYWGHLVDYYFGENGDLEKIVLEKAHRRVISKDEERSAAAPRPHDDDPQASERFYPIKGDYLVIWLDQTTNLNIDYVLAKKKTETAPA
jgi:hypothetical protein